MPLARHQHQQQREKDEDDGLSLSLSLVCERITERYKRGRRATNLAYDDKLGDDAGTYFDENKSLFFNSLF